MTSLQLPQPITEIPTPCFLVDVDIVRRNAKNMIDRCSSLGLKLRPHMKTHKCLWVFFGYTYVFTFKLIVEVHRILLDLTFRLLSVCASLIPPKVFTLLLQQIYLSAAKWHLRFTHDLWILYISIVLYSIAIFWLNVDCMVAHVCSSPCSRSEFLVGYKWEWVSSYIYTQHTIEQKVTGALQSSQKEKSLKVVKWHMFYHVLDTLSGT